MPHQSKKPESYKYDAKGEIAVQQQIMESYQSGVIEQGNEHQTYENKRDQNKLQ
ncbi:hypothetical protein [Alkalihalobacillus sp. AL-G]|uniref:hypothetical protein n=1 Tax=Alkalihalobacillus sp. AL-G TaxID=2926399 RepID=UPI00272C860D|nr:hypothetical protein [Alkalihalobacillus sp. AL-G]WLD92367.1 hypothetical protein MOJ78_15275 [Alkalihalobacillus sp. AL-G]